MSKFKIKYLEISRENYLNAKNKDSFLYAKFEISEFDAEEIYQLVVKAKYDRYE